MDKILICKNCSKETLKIYYMLKFEVCRSCRNKQIQNRHQIRVSSDLFHEINKVKFENGLSSNDQALRKIIEDARK